MKNNSEFIIRDRIYRSSTFEGMADQSGFLKEEYYKLYRDLAKNGVKNIITGCTYISQEGKMVQPGQAGIDDDDKIPNFQRLTNEVHQYSSRIYLQLSHAGRQTSTSVTKMKVVGASNINSAYFNSQPKALNIDEIHSIIDSFASAALRAKHSGFDGIQIHAAHGYLVHQFLHPNINIRTDEYGISDKSGIGELFLEQIIHKIREKCGADYPILVKISASDDLKRPFSFDQLTSLVRLLHHERVYAIEVSYGTMEDALNIFRGKSLPVNTILKHNFRYKKTNSLIRLIWKLFIIPVFQRRVIKYSENYNQHFSKRIKKLTDIPVISVGGIRKGKDILRMIESGTSDYVSLCRPFICEPDFINQIIMNNDYVSKCEYCNICAVMCDSAYPTRCYKR